MQCKSCNASHATAEPFVGKRISFGRETSAWKRNSATENHLDGTLSAVVVAWRTYSDPHSDLGVRRAALRDRNETPTATRAGRKDHQAGARQRSASQRALHFDQKAIPGGPSVLRSRVGWRKPTEALSACRGGEPKRASHG